MPSEVRILHRPLAKCRKPALRGFTGKQALIAQTVEHVLGKNGVMGSNPIEGSHRQQKLS